MRLFYIYFSYFIFKNIFKLIFNLSNIFYNIIYNNYLKINGNKILINFHRLFDSNSYSKFALYLSKYIAGIENTLQDNLFQFHLHISDYFKIYQINIFRSSIIFIYFIVILFN